MAMSHGADRSAARAPLLVWLVPLVPLVLFGMLLRRVSSVTSGEAWEFSTAWAPSLGLTLSFRLDGLAMILALLITGVGVLITSWAISYMAGDPRLPRFQLYLLLFMGSMLGVATADNAILLFVFWELTSISSFLLIGFDHERREAREAALKALLITSGGGLALLAGLVMLGIAGGSLEISQMANAGNHPLYLPILLTVALGCFTKSAQFPFHFWLPAAMEAPTPVSAYLHSATMVKAGVFLLARLQPSIGGTEAWTILIGTTGGITMLVGSWLALRVRDLKQILAYSTISALGMLVLLLGIGTDEAIAAAMVLLIAHALYKASLFLLAGAIDHDAGTRDVSALRGLRRSMPLATIVAAIGAVGLAGFGPVLAFIAKEMMLASALGTAAAGFIIPAVFFASAMLTAVAVLIGWGLFWGRQPEEGRPRKIRESRALIAAPLLLAILSVALALLPAWPARLATAAAAAVTGKWVELELHLWHGVGLPLLLSIGSLLLGIALYATRERWNREAGREGRWSFDRSWAWGIRSLLAGSTRISRMLQSGHLRSYVMIILVTTIGLVAGTLTRSGIAPATDNWGVVRFHEAVIALLIVAASIVAIRSESRLGAVAALGVVGYGVALIYITFSAPDLAMTQFLIETLMVVLFVLVIYHLPRFAKISTTASRSLDAVVSMTVGVMMSLFVLIAASENAQVDAARFFAENSHREAHGRNIVNVILVDFRALDTAGEIVVLSVAAIGVYALLKLRTDPEST